MTAREAAANQRGEVLMAELRQLRARRRAGKRQVMHKLRGYRREGASIRAEAERILATLPRDPQAVIEARRAVLDGLELENDPAAHAAIARAVGAWCPGDSIRSLAELILAELPIDPDAGSHRLSLAQYLRKDRTP